MCMGPSVCILAVCVGEMQTSLPTPGVRVNCIMLGNRVALEQMPWQSKNVQSHFSVSSELMLLNIITEVCALSAMLGMAQC